MARIVDRACVLCEALCGLRIEVENDRILSVRGDPDDPISQGYICPKGVAIGDVHHDPDRLRTPMSRRGDGQFEPIGWDEAMKTAKDGLQKIAEKHGRQATAVYWGNPTIHNHGALLVRNGLNQAIGYHNVYGAGSQDISPRFATSFFLYGSSLVIPVPDIDRTSYFLCMGANPVVSNGSAMTAPNIRKRLQSIRARGGRLVVIDPRFSETAREADEHITIRPGADAALLLGMCAIQLKRGLLREDELRDQTTGWDDVASRLRSFDLDSAAHATGIAIETITRLALEFSEATAPVAYSRVGVCSSQFGTLGTYAMDLLNICNARLGAAGGAMFPSPAIDISRLARIAGMDGYDRWRTRVRGLPETLGEVPSAALSEEIETPGRGQIRGMVTYGGNPVLSVPNGRRLAGALQKLDFMVSVDIYVNETTRHANLILPPAWAMKEDYVDVFFAQMSVRNAARWSPPVLDRQSGDLLDWEILLELATGLGGGPTGISFIDKAISRGSRLGIKWTPDLMLDFLLRTGKWGDRYLPWHQGLSMRKLRKSPHGVDLGPLKPGTRHRIKHRDGRVHLLAQPISKAWDLLCKHMTSGNTSKLVLIGRRDARSNNSWMHNIDALMRGSERCRLLVNPKDAKPLNIRDGELCVLESRVHRGEVRVELTEEISQGVVSLPHGWGHDPSADYQSVASHRPGVSVNDWTDETNVESVVGQSILNGVPVSLSRCTQKSKSSRRNALKPAE